MVRVPSRRDALAGAGAALAVAALTAAVFWPALGNGFIDLYDDGPYVLGNEVVRRGLTWSGVAWAFTTVHVHNWHPVSWLSHMVDVQAFGLDPWGHHLTSVLLHAGNAALVVALLAAIGLRPWGAAAMGALFSLHPLRVQSVAWVAERKDLLSAFLGLAAILLYVGWTRRRAKGWYAASLACFAMGLLAKPMVVTLPAVLLLLDAWPLARPRRGGEVGAEPGAPGSPEPVGWRAALLEKLPFAVLSLAVAGVTLLVQGSSGAIAESDEFPLGLRLGNAAVSVFAYLGKLAWPADLAVYYPHPGSSLSAVAVLAATAALVAVTVAAAASWRRAPWLLVGWLWWLAMLLPVLGIVQAGRQGMADRYTYLPTVGILLALAFSFQALLRRARAPWVPWALGGATVVACAALAVETRANVALWRDSGTLFRHAAGVTERNAVAANALGVLEARAGRLDGALALYRKAVEYDPTFGTARQNLAGLLYALGLDAEGWPHAVEAVRLEPRNPQARFVLGVALESQGRLPEAAAEYEAALALRPDYEKARLRLDAVRSAGGAAPR